MKIKIKHELLSKAKEELNLNKNDLKIVDTKFQEDLKFVEIDCDLITVSLLSFFLKNSSNMANAKKTLLSTKLLGEDVESSEEDEIWETEISKLKDIAECFSRMGKKNFNADIFYNKAWYPVKARALYRSQTSYLVEHIYIPIQVSFEKEFTDIGFNIHKADLKDADGKMRTLKDLFIEFGCRPQKKDLNEYKANLDICNKLKNTTNKQMLCNGAAVFNMEKQYQYSKNIKEERVIIEPELEYNDNSNPRVDKPLKKNYTPLPVIRVFLFSRKKYVFVDINSLSEYNYNLEAHNRIFLPDSIKKSLNAVLSSPADSLVGDILDNKHGGIIILAHGNPGVGKTSTAEVYSEMQQLPLYSIDIAELGIDSESIEKNLNILFKRVEKWKAIVLFDEIDIFLAKREKSDLNRSAIVGVFLRLMDYFKGLMFLTSNRLEVLDFAISSRITLKIKFPDLDKETRAKIWADKTSKAGMKIKGGFSKVSQIDLNGREIRNLTRLAKIVYPKGATQENLINLIELNKMEIVK